LGPAVFLLSILTTAGFGSGTAAEAPAGGPAVFDAAAVDRIVYHFQDASVPPPYHRSYTIDVTQKSVRIVVDSYGDVLADEVFHVDSLQFDRLKQILRKSGLHKCQLDAETGCTGGTGERINLYAGEKELFAGNVYHCGGQKSGNLCGDLASLADAVKALIPEIESLLQ